MSHTMNQLVNQIMNQIKSQIKNQTMNQINNQTIKIQQIGFIKINLIKYLLLFTLTSLIVKTK